MIGWTNISVSPAPKADWPPYIVMAAPSVGGCAMSTVDTIDDLHNRAIRVIVTKREVWANGLVSLGSPTSHCAALVVTDG